MTKPFLARSHALESAALGLVRDPFAGELIALEPRIVFDGAALAVAVEATKQATPDTPAATGDSTGSDSTGDHPSTDASASPDPAKLSAALIDSPAGAAASAAPPRQVVFVDSRVSDHDAFKTSAGADALVVVVEADEDGLGAISRTLAGMTNVDAVHIVSHGEEGAFKLGKDWVTGESLKAREADLQAWAFSLSAGADILLYGCDIAAGAEGEALIASLAEDTGADVAASADAVGKTDTGADWTLEKTTGTIEAKALAPEGYGHALVTTGKTQGVEFLIYTDNVHPATSTLTLIRGAAYSVTNNLTNDTTPTFKGKGEVTGTNGNADVARGSFYRLYATNGQNKAYVGSSNTITATVSIRSPLAPSWAMPVRTVSSLLALR